MSLHLACQWPRRVGLVCLLIITGSHVPGHDASAADVADTKAARMTGETKCWHDIRLDFEGPEASETDDSPNPFTDLALDVTFEHVASGRRYDVPGYFAADGNAAETGATSGNVWRCHFVPDAEGTWAYRSAGVVAVAGDARTDENASAYHGTFDISPTDKSGRDFRGRGMLRYVGKRYLQFAGDETYFLKAGADAPETLLAYRDFDATVTANEKRGPLKTWEKHVQDWRPGDPSWQNGKGKGLIGAINYLSGKGCNAFSFLTYNAGGDGDNVWPFVSRDDKLHYDCSKLDQWNMVFAHGTSRGMYLHFKLQETENDDNHRGKENRPVPESLDGGDLGPQRKLYLREIIARFGHHLALNWNLGEENTQSTEQQKAMIDFIAETDPYDHPIVLHTYPNEQKKVYEPLLGDASELAGLSLQNSHIKDTHAQTVYWVRRTTEAGRPLVVAFDESGSAAHGQCPDVGYRGFDGRDSSGKMIYTPDAVRHQTLWGTLLGGGGGVEYYFGYKFVENDLVCEDWRSRDGSWEDCARAIGFFHDNEIAFEAMLPADELVGNPEFDNDVYCLAAPGSDYIIYRPRNRKVVLDLTAETGSFDVRWFNPRSDEVSSTGSVATALLTGSVATVVSGSNVDLGDPPQDADRDWVIRVRATPSRSPR